MRQGTWARWLNLLLGAWLIASTFAWRHDGPEGFDTLMIGIVVASCAPLALWAPWFRFASTLAGVWLLVMALHLTHVVPATLLHDAILSAAVIAVSLVPSPPRFTRAGRALA